jgi:hypothetical protein
MPVPPPDGFFDNLTPEDIIDFETCDYRFTGKTVQALCSYAPNHRTGHGRWRDPDTNQPI